MERASAQYRAGNGYFDQGQFKIAAEAYSAAITENPSFVEACHNLALANEMVNRKQAIEAWKRFLDAATGNEKFKFDVARVQARIQLLNSMAELPMLLQPDRYMADAGDYYPSISGKSEGEEWKRFPVKVFVGDPRERDWQKAAREAFQGWATFIPLELVNSSGEADISVGWGMNDFVEVGMVWEDATEDTSPGGIPSPSRPANRTANPQANWPKTLIRAFVSHQLGHALGIKGHSDRKEDIMFGEVQARSQSVSIGDDQPRRGRPRSVDPRSDPKPVTVTKMLSAKGPSQRDINTSIRLYNHAGSSVRFR